MKLTEFQKGDIEAVVCNNMDNLEDVINTNLKGLIEGIDSKLSNNQDALIYAREIFFKG